MGDNKFSFLRRQFSILGLEHPDDPENLADKITCQEECIGEILHPRNGGVSDFSRINGNLQDRYMLRYFKRKLSLVKGIIERLEDKIPNNELRD